MTAQGDLTRFVFYRGRVALHAILKALNLPPGSLVATQAFTCLAVPEAIMAAGYKPIFIDIEPEGVNMSASDLRDKLSPGVGAVIIQHTFGISAQMDELSELCRANGTPLIEDCCHTFDSSFQGQQVGSLGKAAFYSFEWGKPIVAGIGGAARINDPALRATFERLYAGYTAPTSSRLRINIQYLGHRVLYRPSFYWPVRSFYHWLGSLGAAESNYNPVEPERMADDFGWKMHPSLAARLPKKLSALADVTAHSRRICNAYSRGIHTNAARPPVQPAGSDTVFARYPLIADDKTRLLKEARRADVELAEWYCTPVHPLRSKEELSTVHYVWGSCPQAEARCEHIVSLPTHHTVKK